jgi:His/Glu/Gln/Arg/opine family amino acid ABC transporter permease subunit
VCHRHRRQFIVLVYWPGIRFLLACAKLSGPRWLKVPVELYIWFFRSVPLMVLLVFVYNLPQLFPATQPLLGIPFIAGLVSMTVTEAAYMAEIHRGGLLSVAKGQSEAGHALSFSFIGIQRLIIIPQAFRISLPTLINEYITIIKLSSICRLFRFRSCCSPASACMRKISSSWRRCWRSRSTTSWW